MAARFIERAKEMNKRELDAELFNQFKQGNVLNSIKLIETGADPLQEHGNRSILEHLIKFQTRDPALRKSVTDFFVRMKNREQEKKRQSDELIESKAMDRVRRSLEIEDALKKIRKKGAP